MWRYRDGLLTKISETKPETKLIRTIVASNKRWMNKNTGLLSGITFYEALLRAHNSDLSYLYLKSSGRIVRIKTLLNLLKKRKDHRFLTEDSWLILIKYKSGSYITSNKDRITVFLLHENEVVNGA